MSREDELRKKRALADTVDGLNWRYGEGTVCLAAELPKAKWRSYPTGDDYLDAALGIDGVPVGKIVEIYGPESGGKTSVALQMARKRAAALYIDADHALDPEAAKGLYLARVDTLEDALHMVKIAAAGFDMVVIDTLTALPTRAEVERAIGDFSAEPQSKVLSRCLPQLLGLLDRNRCTLVLVNQVRDKAGICFGNPEHSTGGRAVKCFASVRLEVRTRKEASGREWREITVAKNRYGPPFRKVVTELGAQRGVGPYW